MGNVRLKQSGDEKLGKVRKLYSELKVNQFSFMDEGEWQLQGIYSAVKSKYPCLCDDGLVCCQCCKGSRDRVPEWQHRVRTVLCGLCSDKGSVQKGLYRGYWIIERK
jgi:hypothetical protein